MTVQRLGRSGIGKVARVLVFLLMWLSIPMGTRMVSAQPITLNSDSSNWVPVLVGDKFDPGNDKQAQSAVDLVGDADNPLMYMYYDDTTDEMYMRYRVDEARAKQDFDGYLWIGMDVDFDGDLDLFIMLSGKNAKYTLDVYSAGAGANNSPSTTSISTPVALATLTVGTTFNIDTVANIDGPGANGNVDKDANPDDFVSFKFNFNTFATIANAKSLTGSTSKISTINNNQGLTKDTPLRFVIASASNTNSLNGDLGGYSSTDSTAVTYAQQGAFSTPLSLGNPADEASEPEPDPDPEPAAITLTGPTAVTAGQASGQFTLTVVDANDDPVAIGQNTTFALSSNSQGTVTFSPGTTVTVPNGSSSVTFTYTDTEAGLKSVTATWTSGGANLGDVVHDITVDAAAPAKLAFVTQPSDAEASEPIAPAVTVLIEDSYGNLTDSTATVTIEIGTNPSAGTLSGTTSVAAVNGLASFGNLRINKAGQGYTLSASASGLTGAISDAFDITGGAPISLNLDGLLANNKVYDGTVDATIRQYGSLDGIVGSDEVTLVTAGASASFANANAGNGKTVTVTGLSLAGPDAAKYTIGNQTTTANITPKALTLADLVADNKVFDGNTDATISSYGLLDGVVGGDDVSLVTAGASATFADANVGNGKTVTVTGLSLGGAKAANYTIGNQTTTANITAAPLVVLNLDGLIADDKVYDGTTDATIRQYGSLDGVVGSDAVELVTTGASASFANANAGNGKTVTVTGLSLAGPDAAKYTIGNQTTTADITPKALTLADLVADNKVFDGNTDATISSYGLLDGVVGTDTVTLVTAGATATFADANVGNGKTVTVIGLSLGGAKAANYTIGNQTTTANITAAPLVVLNLDGLLADNKVYDGTTDATIRQYGSLDGIVGSDEVTLVTAGAGASFADANAGNGKTVTVTGLSLAGPDAAKYTIGNQTTTASITPKALTLDGLTAADKAYDGNTDATITSYGTLNGIVAGEKVDLVTTGATATFADANPSNGKTVTVTGLGLDGPDAGNYSIGAQTTTATIRDEGTLKVTVETDFGPQVPGVTVEVYDQGGNKVASGIADADGQVQVVLPSGEYTVKLVLADVEIEETVTVVLGQVTSATLTIPTTAELTFTASPQQLVGDGISTAALTATVRQSGQSVAGVVVHVAATHGTLSATSAVTGPDGQATVTLTSPDLSGTLEALATTLTATVIDPVRSLFGAKEITATFVPATVKGVITYGGQPKAGAIVTITEVFNGKPFEVTVVTDAFGRYEIVVPYGNHRYELDVSVPVEIAGQPVWIPSKQYSDVDPLQGVGEQYDAETSVGGLLVMKDGASAQPKTLNQVLPPDAQVSGTIYDVKTGNPLPNPVSITADGVYRVDGVAPGTYRVIFRVEAPGAPLLAGTAVTITVEANGELALETGLIDPYGIVRDSRTKDPVVGATVSLWWADTKVNRDAGRVPDTLVRLPLLDGFPPADNAVPHDTSPAGEYAWMVFADGDYYITATAPGYRKYDSRVERRNVPAGPGEDSWITNGIIHVGETIVEYNFEMVFLSATPDPGPAPGPAPTAVVSGVVTDTAGGTPLAGAVLTVVWADTEQNLASGRTRGAEALSPVVTGADGTYTWSVPTPADVVIHVSLDGYEASASPVLSLQAGASTRNIGLTALPKPAPTPEPGPQPAPQPQPQPQPEPQPAPVVALEAGSHHRYITGYPDGTFKPEQSITRAEVATILVRIRNLAPTSVAHPFPDVDASHWANGYIAAAYANGLVSGDPNTMFRPQDFITRAEVAAIALRFKGASPLSYAAFPDTEGHWAAGIISAASFHRYLVGYPDGLFKPDQPISRAEFVTVINRLLGRGPLTGVPKPTFPDTPFWFWASDDVEEAATSHSYERQLDGTERWLENVPHPVWW